MKIDIVYTYYNGINLLEKYIDHWNNNFNDVKHKINFILIDDHSDESCKAINIVQKMDINFNFQLYHVDDNILWNEMGARNLGGSISTSDTLLFLDWDHLITQELIHEIFTWPFDEKHMYLFHRKKYKNHMPLWEPGQFNNWLQENKLISTPGTKNVPVRSGFCLTRKLWEDVGGFDEDFAGNYGKYDRMFRTNVKNHGVKEVLINNIPIILMFCAETQNVTRDNTSKKINLRTYKRKQHNFYRPENMLRFKFSKQYENCIMP